MIRAREKPDDSFKLGSDHDPVLLEFRYDAYKPQKASGHHNHLEETAIMDTTNPLEGTAYNLTEAHQKSTTNKKQGMRRS